MSSDETSLPNTVEEARRVLGLDPRADASASAVKRAARERFVEAHPDVPSGSRTRFMAVMRARSMLLSAIDGGANVGGSSVRVSAAETAARRARENALPKHVRAFFLATGAVLAGVALVRSGAEARKRVRSPIVRGALGLPNRRSDDEGAVVN